MTETPSREARPLAGAIRRHALGWLVAGNLTGLWLAALLLWPRLNDFTAPLTYGRWMPLHLDWQLYGWCALPLVGALLHYFLRPDAAGAKAGRVALGLWSAGLGFGGLMWLGGTSSGKLFLEWAGPARIVWPLALLGVWLVLAWQVAPRRREFPGWTLLLLALLAVVPFALWWATDPRVYPAVDPDTGGATGSSLLGSTLGLLAIFGALPWLLRLPVAARGPTVFHRKRLYGFYLFFSFALDAALKRGNVTHHDLGHILGLASLAAWVPLVWQYARSFAWPAAVRSWLVAAFVWWLVLVVNGFISFLPEVADRFKFTNGLVAHAHLAMAGCVTSLYVALLGALGGHWRVSRWSAWTWQLAGAVHVGALLWLGWREAAEPGLLYVRGGVADWCYGLRFVAGAAMLAASIDWLRAAWNHDHE